ncbi:ectonucleoside triphosphate diphosphohydrolase 8-like [Spea bombifrons]|uniref:ectonucleoside triphosphate diphosphohydrolase 8-like n=1 Tax=Spea bombifrons TaxID=233779 RepID=UPI00234A8F35|nr:ectonucleoside triphosphate diphosphohydrolase 8-like [Spea bombifrons]XP_053329794.1 ectonucleoside triphosphate diphosphohydrolase 8-like [Spea bombifrons]
MCRNRKGLAVGCLIIVSLVSAFIALVLSIVDVRNVYQPSPDKYGIVFDAGSSHTSLYVYRWPADKENDTGIVSQVHACHVNGPGLSGYADRPDQAGASLKPCMDEALAIIPKSQHAETTTLLGATAGMRLLNLQNETLTQTIFAEVSKTLRTFPVRFQGARILTGNEEGSLGWITVNYLLGTFVTHSLMNIWIHPGSQILGAMDLGGASTQMTFLPSGAIEDKSTEMSFRLYGYNYTIYTHSYLCYGQDQVFKRILTQLIQNKGNDLENVTHPCYPKGYTGSVSLSSVVDSPCVTQIPGDPVRNVTVRGTGDPDSCLTAVRHIMNFTACNKSPCSFDGVYQPPVQGEFYAFSAFYYTLSFLNLTSGQSLEATNRSVRAFCSEEWSKLIGAFPSESQTRLSQYCSSATYILTLLTDGYRFTDRTWNNIHFAKQIGDAEVGWTLGYMLNLTNMIPSEAAGQLKGQRYSFWVASLFFIALSVAAGLVAAPLHCFRRNTCAGQGGWS